MRPRSHNPRRGFAYAGQIAAAFLGAFAAAIVAFIIAMNPDWVKLITHKPATALQAAAAPAPAQGTPQALKQDLLPMDGAAQDVNCSTVTLAPRPPGQSDLPKLASAAPAQPQPSGSDQNPDEIQDVLNAPDGYNPANDAQASTAPAGTQTYPTLYKDNATGAITIGNFKPTKVNGDNQQCAAIGQAMLKDSGLAPDALQTVLDTKFIVIERICAANGAVILTCRNGRIAISPRRSRPDDGCARPN